MSKSKPSKAKSEDGVVLRLHESLIDEGDYFMHVKKIGKAIDCYSKALEIQADDEHCLVARSRCYLLEGMADNALLDAEAALVINQKNPKNILQKAEVLYIVSEFENALVLFHRGNKARPEIGAFRLGIQKCEEAIYNSVGDPSTIKLNLNCDLSYFFKNEEKLVKKKPGERATKKKMATESITSRIDVKPYDTDDRTVKQLLGELYTDREYLERLLNAEETMAKKTEKSEEIRELAVKGLNYLNNRSEFWQQERPMYARKKRTVCRPKRDLSAKSQQQTEIIKYVVTSLDEIDENQAKSEHRKAISQCTRLLKQIGKWSDIDLPNRLDIQANVYCLAGNSYLELGDYEKSLEYHNKDSAIGRQYKLDEAISRSIDNLGRVYAKKGQFGRAIQIWREKIPLSQSALESTWLHHEMGRCYLELEDNLMAMEYGEKSLDFAREADDDTWQMNASILVAQAAVKSRKFSQAIEYFERALEYSKIMKNIDAESAIKNAIEETNKRIIEEEPPQNKVDAVKAIYVTTNDIKSNDVKVDDHGELGEEDTQEIDIKPIEIAEESKEDVDYHEIESSSNVVEPQTCVSLNKDALSDIDESVEIIDCSDNNKDEIVNTKTDFEGNTANFNMVADKKDFNDLQEDIEIQDDQIS